MEFDVPELHPAAELTGGRIPAHVPGAYPRLSCCDISEHPNCYVADAQMLYERGLITDDELATAEPRTVHRGGCPTIRALVSRA